MLLIRQILIADRLSPLAGQVADILLQEGRISKLSSTIDAPADCPIYEGKGQWVSPGFLDIGAFLGDPGAEEREDAVSLAAAGVRGGYTQLAVLPNTSPVRQDKAGVEYLRRRSTGLSVDLLPLAALSQDTEGRDLTEMIDLHRAGAVGFTDGLHPVNNARLLRLALEYVKTFAGTIINQPFQGDLSPDAQLHEGELSTRLGMRGFPTLTETIPLQRDLALLAYSESRLLVHLLSSKSGVELLREAKSRGEQVFGSVSAAHLQFTVAALADFDPNYKLLPPLREEDDRKALIEGVLDGTIDHVASHHQSHQPEAKILEFSYADFGSQFLETCVAQSYTVLGDRLSPEDFCALFSHGPRRALGLTEQRIVEGEPASLSLFDPEKKWTPATEDFGKKSVNTPLLGQALRGRPVATYHNNRLWTSA